MGIHKKKRNEGNRENTWKGFKKNIQTTRQSAYTEILMDTGIWPREQRIQYAALMLYHNIKNSNEERKMKKIIEEQEKKNYNNTFYKNTQQISENFEIEIDKVTGKKKSTWKKKSEGEMSKEMAGRTKCRTIVEQLKI